MMHGGRAAQLAGSFGINTIRALPKHDCLFDEDSMSNDIAMIYRFSETTGALVLYIYLSIQSPV
jgi:hypothetical protein